jgi:formylmethanofuran dehydrogenase subunit C
VSGVRLRLRARLELPLEAPCVRPDLFATLAAGEIARLPVEYGRELAHLGDFFSVDGERSDRLRVEGDVARVKRLGAEMAAGELVVEGAAGRHAGAAMSGGTLRVLGDADDFTGTAMRGGLLEVRGRVGSHFCAATPGSARGMSGGVAIVRGAAGPHAADRVRRGIVAIGGDAGPYAGAHMVAGTLLVNGACAHGAGVGLKRGTIVAGGSIELLPTFRYACRTRPGFLELVRRLLASHGFETPRLATGRFERYGRDFADLGRGEILKWIPA